MSTLKESIPKWSIPLPVWSELVCDYLEKGYDLEASKRLAKFDVEYFKTLTLSEAKEYLALRKRIK